MTGARIEISANEREITDALRRLERAVWDLRPVFDEIGARLELGVARRFETARDPDGVPWPKSRRARDDRGKTLTDTARLRQSITRQVRATQVAVGTNVKYAAIHQFGGKTGPRTIRPRRKKALFWPGAAHPVKKVEHPGSTMPKRAFLGVSSQDRRALLRILERHIRRAIR